MAEQETESGALGKKEIAELAVKVAEHFVRFTGLANAGGAIATITIIGSTAHNGQVLPILAVPLAFFALGISLTLLLTVDIVFKLAKAIRKGPPTTFRAYRRIMNFLEKHEDTGMVGAVICFILGCTSGILIIAFASSA